MQLLSISEFIILTFLSKFAAVILKFHFNSFQFHLLNSKAASNNMLVSYCVPSPYLHMYLSFWKILLLFSLNLILFKVFGHLTTQFIN